MLQNRIAEYARIRTESVRDRLTLSRATLTAILARARNPAALENLGRYIRRPIVLRPFGIRIGVRPRTDDFTYALENHKASLRKWFSAHPGEFVVDIGAHLGLYALWAASSGADVIAIEANPSTYAMLVHNVGLNPGLSVLTLNLAAGFPAGELNLFDAGDRSGVSSVVEGWTERFGVDATATVRVQVRTLDDILSSSKLRPVDWLLIDAEGSERAILSGARDTLLRTRRIVIEVAHEFEVECAQLLTECGFVIRAKERQNNVNSYWLAEAGGVTRATRASTE